MSSPGKASWCICVRMSPGSIAQHAEVGSLGAEDGGELLEAGLGGGVGAPALVGLDGGVGGDGDDGGAGTEVGEQRLHDPELGDEVDLEGRAEVAEPEAGSAAGAGDGPSVPALSTSRSRPPSDCGGDGEVVAVGLVGDVADDGDRRGVGLGQGSTASARSAAWRPSTTRAQPSSARERARARPRPREAPVMSGGGGWWWSCPDRTDGAVRRHRPRDGLCLRRRS